MIIKMTSTLFTAALVVTIVGCSSTSDNTQLKQVEFKAPRLLPYTVNVSAPMHQSGQSFSKAEIKTSANLVADWQLRHQVDFLNSSLTNFQGLKRYSFGGWLMGTMAIGMTEWGQVEGNEQYLDFIRNQAQAFEWQVEERVYDADDYIIGQTYLELYEIDKQAQYLVPLTQRLDYLYDNWPTVNKTSEVSCEQLLKDCRERWTWIDALFMGGPVWAQMAKSTGNQKYLEFAEHEYWASFDKFWDQQESLLYRDSRFLTARDEDGSKIFWSRGNGWVFASIPRMVEALPNNHGSKEKYIARFKAMASKLADIQQQDGSWYPSLLNPTRFNMPESSGSSFFTYGLAWGINQGYLDKSIYMPVVERAWQSLTKNIYADGRLGYVQPSGYDPRTVHKEDTDVYGVGAFLLAASEVYRLANN